MGSLVAFWERVAGRQKEQQYRQMVRDLAAFKEPDPDELDGLLRAMDRSVEDIKADVELLRKRQALWAEFKLKEPSERDKAIAQEKLAAADVVLAKAQEVHKQATDPLHHTLWLMGEKIKAAWEAERQLQSTCPYPELRSRLKAATERLGAASKAHSDHTWAAGHFREAAKNLRARAGRAEKILGGDPKEPERLRKLADESDAKAAAHDAKNARHEAEMKEAQREEREVVQLMLEP